MSAATCLCSNREAVFGLEVKICSPYVFGLEVKICSPNVFGLGSVQVKGCSNRQVPLYDVIVWLPFVYSATGERHG